jgi:hypothetical protein
MSLKNPSHSFGFEPANLDPVASTVAITQPRNFPDLNTYYV